MGEPQGRAADLVSQLEQSVADAKAARDRKVLLDFVAGKVAWKDHDHSVRPCCVAAIIQAHDAWLRSLPVEERMAAMGMAPIAWDNPGSYPVQHVRLDLIPYPSRPARPDCSGTRAGASATTTSRSDRRTRSATSVQPSCPFPPLQRTGSDLKMTTPLNPEIKALRAIVRALEPLDEAAQMRAVEWVYARWNNTTPSEVRRQQTLRLLSFPPPTETGTGEG